MFTKRSYPSGQSVRVTCEMCRILCVEAYQLTASRVSELERIYASPYICEKCKRVARTGEI